MIDVTVDCNLETWKLYICKHQCLGDELDLAQPM